MKLGEIFSIIWICGLSINFSDGQRTFTCKVYEDDPKKCIVWSQTSSSEGKTNFEMDPSSADSSEIELIWFTISSLYAIPSEIFTSFPHLKHLLVVGLSVKEILEKTFENAGELRNLILANNKIQVLNDDDFVGATNMEGLTLANNKLAIIHRHAFRGLDNLKELYLHDNKITSMSDQAFVNLKNLEKLWLSGNICVNENFNHCDPVEVIDKLKVCNENYVPGNGEIQV